MSLALTRQYHFFFLWALDIFFFFFIFSFNKTFGLSSILFVLSFFLINFSIYCFFHTKINFPILFIVNKMFSNLICWYFSLLIKKLKIKKHVSPRVKIKNYSMNLFLKKYFTYFLKINLLFFKLSIICLLFDTYFFSLAMDSTIIYTAIVLSWHGSMPIVSK